ncbi:MAG: hypothetical protein AB7P21_06955 [Lautropia sp.]
MTTWRWRRARRGAPVAAAIVVLAACTSVSTGPQGPVPPTEDATRGSGAEALSGAQARAVLGGPVRYRWTTAQGAKGNAILDGKGAVRLFWETGAVNGRIRFNENGYCTRYRNVRDGKEDCYRLYRIGADEYRVFRVDGRFSGTIVIQPRL